MADFLMHKKGSLNVTEVSATYPTMASKSKGSNAKVDGGADQGTGIVEMCCETGKKNSPLNFSADVKVIG